MLLIALRVSLVGNCNSNVLKEEDIMNYTLYILRDGDVLTTYYGTDAGDLALCGDLIAQDETLDYVILEQQKSPDIAVNNVEAIAA